MMEQLQLLHGQGEWLPDPEQQQPTPPPAKRRLVTLALLASALAAIATVVSLGQTRQAASASSSSSTASGSQTIISLSSTDAKVDAARFGLHATFGPTRDEVKKMSQGSFASWISKQMALPPELHRAHYRARTNPPFEAADGALPEKGPLSKVHYRARAPCARGARFHVSALGSGDVGKRISIHGHKILVDGTWRSDMQRTGSKAMNTCSKNSVPPYLDKQGIECQSMPPKMCRSQCRTAFWHMPKHHWCQQRCFDCGAGYHGDKCSMDFAARFPGGFDGYICSVEEQVGGQVGLAPSEKCTLKSRHWVPNPAVHRASATTQLQGKLVASSEFAKGPLFLSEASTSCTGDRGSMVQFEGKFYRHDARLELLENTPERPQLLDADNCVARSFLNERGCRVRPKSAEGCHVICGSPGEVANDPMKGHQLPFLTQRPMGVRAFFYDNLYHAPYMLGKSIVWTDKALHAPDQLRQRTAWALSQVFVVGAPDIGKDMLTECWTNYYDIFVRHAFGNFRDIMREVTYSPIMAFYLTYASSRSFDFNGAYPDENYARELMQLFSIGLSKLNEDGSPVLDDQGSEVPTYSNDNIMSFARVFTGLQPRKPRSNIEFAGQNLIDPMAMNPRWHDSYPKSDLDGNYLGDGYPLCADIPTRSFLSKGAKFEFLGYAVKGHELFEPPQGSNLRAALCRAGAGGTCAFAATVELEADLDCRGVECQMDTVSVLQVDDGFYEYVPPPCVHLFFYAGKLASMRKRPWITKCEDGSQAAASVACCAGCSDRPPPWYKKNGQKCDIINSAMSKNVCNNVLFWKWQKFCELSCSRFPDAAYAGSNCSVEHRMEQCVAGGAQMRYGTAEATCAKLGLQVCADRAPKEPCGHMAWTPEDCAPEVWVHADGKVSGHTEKAENRFAVTWESGKAPPAGHYNSTVEVAPVFTAVPSKEQLLQKLKFRAFPPKGRCTHSCHGSVRAFAPGGHFDENAVFEHNGRFYRNAESVVQVSGSSFRNPPVFMPPATPILASNFNQQRRAALEEVESLLEHLFQHPNTPVFISKKLIQRFVSSSPSPEYVKAVAEAFRTGSSFGGIRTSGHRGDLAATIATVLLHPETRSGAGLLREPLLRLIHFLRSMEFEEQGQQVTLKNLEGVIGEFPYHSPSVFNFYMDDFEPSRWLKKDDEEESEPDPEPEPQEMELEPVAAPEFQVFTPPFALGLVNGLMSITQDGLGPCKGGFGFPASVWGCNHGKLRFEEGTTPAETLSNLNLLLTGGRLTPKNAEAVRAAYDAAEQGEELQAAQQAMVLTPEFHTQGEPKPEGERPPSGPARTAKPKSYRATVMLFLSGGADTFHMLVPVGCSLYDEYKTARAGAVLSQSQLLPINTEAQACKKFGIHPNLKFVKELYEKQQAAFMSNVGALVEPVTRATLARARKCHGLFSHSDQQAAAQTLKCQQPGAAPKGAGGRVADALAEQGYRVDSFSVAGTSTWSEGFRTHGEIVGLKGSIRLHDHQRWAATVGNMTHQRYGNAFVEEYSHSFADAVRSSEDLAKILKDVELSTKYQLHSPLEHQLHEVARLIAAREPRGAERDFFFVQLGGFDTHSNLAGKFAQLMTQLDSALDGFVTELKAQGVFKDTVLSTASDFGRTLTINSGGGTDHGWGGNHMVLGGDLQGGQVFNDFPETFAEGNDFDAGRGRMIPKYPWESFMVPIAEWMDLKEPKQVFPNLAAFNHSHIISRGRLFKS